MYGRNFGRGRGGRWGGWGRRRGGAPGWGGGPAWPEAGWGGGPGWGYRWQWEARQLPPEERRAYLEAFKSHLQARLEEVDQMLAELNEEA